MKTIMIVDDDVYIGNMLEETLQNNKYQTIRAYSGTEALYILNVQKPDLILLDLMLPGLNGEEVLKHLQGIPVIVVSAKIQTCDKVNVLLGGAVDYVTKPFDTEELLARIAVHLRNVSTTVNQTILQYDQIKMDTGLHTVSVSNTPVRLTKTEYAILKILIHNPNQVISKSQILDLISQDTPDCMESSLKVHVSNLRKKLREVNEIDYIESVWGIGFKLCVNNGK